MPPRKSTSRKSDVTAARSAPAEDAQPKESLSFTPANATPAAEPSPAAGTPSEKKDKEKEKDKDKEKEKEKDKDKEKEKEKEKEKSKGHDDAVAIEDLTLPKSIITRLSKGVLPPNTQIQGNAILALSNSATVFISYLASHANENTLAAGKKTISPADVFKALEDTEFSFLRESLEAEFAKFNAIQTEKRTSYRQKVRAKKSDGPDTDMTDTSLAEGDGDTTMASEASGPRTKRARVDPTAAPEAEEDDAETEDEGPVPEDDDEDNEDEEGDEEEEEAEASGDETQDALEEKQGRDDADEALDGDESD